MVKNIVSALCLVVVGMFAAVISINTPLYAATQNSSNLFGQAQSYDVLLRGDGGAIVNAKFQVSNNDETAKTKYSYSLANGELKTVTAYQEITCSSLPTIISQNGQTTTTAGGISSTTIQGYDTDTDTLECYPGYNKNPTTDSTSTKTSTRYYAPIRNNIYKKIDTKINGNSFDLTLPNAVKSGQSANIIMVYNTANISNGTLGIHKFTFTTLKTDEQIVSANIAISVDEGYYLADSSKVKNNYLQKNSSSLNNALQSGTTANSSLDSAAQSYINSIGNNGMITKTANQILPGETFSVSGKFATSTLLINWPRYLLICIVAVSIVGLLLFWYIIRRKRILRQQAAKASQNLNNTSDSKTETNDEAENTQDLKIDQQTYNEQANVYSNQDAASANVRSIPFYGLYHSAKLKYREQTIRPMFFAWLCALYLIIFGAFLTGIGFLYGNNIDSNGFGYGLSTPETIIQIAISFSLAIAGVLGFLLICIGLPFLYAKNAKGAFKIIIHMLLVFIVIAIIATFISVAMPDNKYHDNYGLPECGSGNICIQ